MHGSDVKNMASKIVNYYQAFILGNITKEYFIIVIIFCE